MSHPLSEGWPPEVVELFQAELDAYDRLDPRLREFIANAPKAIYPMIDILNLQQTYGVDATLAAVKDLLRRLQYDNG